MQSALVSVFFKVLKKVLEKFALGGGVRFNNTFFSMLNRYLLRQARYFFVLFARPNAGKVCSRRQRAF